MARNIRTRVVRGVALAVLALAGVACSSAQEAGEPATGPSDRIIASVAPTATAPATAPAATATTPAAVAPATPDEGAPDDTDGGGQAGGVTVGPGMQRVVDLAIQDLAARLGVSPDAITVVAAEPVTWPDTSLGCPQPDRRYLQIPTDGSRVHLRVHDTLYRYHTGGRRVDPFLCAPGAAKSTPPIQRLEPRLDGHRDR